MARNYITPDTYIEEIDQFPTNLAGVSTSIPVIYGTTEWGPVNTPTRIKTDFSRFRSVFGTFQTTSQMAYQVKAFFDEGGQECLINRIAHYTDPTVLDDVAATKASYTILGKSGYGYNASITCEGKYYGVLGNRLSITLAEDPVKTSLGAGDDLSSGGAVSGNSYIVVPSLYGYVKNMTLLLNDASGYETAIISRTETVSGENRIILDGPLDNTYDYATTTIRSMEFTLNVFLDGVLIETFAQLSTYDQASNYFVTVVNDTYGGSGYVSLIDIGTDVILDDFPEDITTQAALSGATAETIGLTNLDKIGSSSGLNGLYAMDKVTGIASLACFPNVNSTVQTSAHAYFENRGDILFVGGVPQADVDLSMTSITTVDSAIEWRQKAGFSSKYGSLFFPWIDVDDPIGAGSAPTKEIDPVGSMLGLMARVDSKPAPDGGVWASPAGPGADFGKLKFARGVAYKVARNDSEAGALNEAGINALLLLSPGGVTAWGINSLSNLAIWRQYPVVRLFIYLEETVKQQTEFALFRGNNTRWWDLLRTAVSNFLDGVRINGGLDGATRDEAFFVKVGIDDGVMTNDDVVNGRLIGEFGAKPTRSSEYIIWRVTQINTGESTVESI